MSLLRYQDTTFLEYKTNWFVWEPSWESFRPITSVEWNGTSFVLNDTLYCSDPMDPLYGYGTSTMKHVCDALSSKYASQISNAKQIQTPAIGPLTWMYDRFVSVSPCAPQDRASWKRIHRGNHKTLHKPLSLKFTRRVRI